MAKFLKKNGYYIMLAVCLVCIAALIIVAVTSTNKINELKKPDVTPTSTTSPTVTPTVTPTDATPTPTTSTDADITSFSLPVAEAIVGMDFSVDQFVFSETLNQWQTHNGVDFVTDTPTAVMSIGEGTVESVITDDVLMGGTVVVDHGNNVKSYYKSLATDIPVKAGDKVDAKSTLGMTSMSAYSEYKEGVHLHLEMTVDGELVDPKEYLNITK